MPPKLTSSSLFRVPAGRIALAAAMIAAVTAVAFGTGFTTTKVLSGDGTVWLQKGHTITQVNTASDRYQATVSDQQTKLAMKVQDPLKIVQTPGSPSQVYASDPVTHKVYRINLSTMEPQAVDTSGDDVLAARKAHYIVDQAKGTITSFNPQTLALGTPIQVPGGIASATITPSGVVYLGTDNGTVTVVKAGKLSTTSLGKGTQGHQIQVSVVGKRPVAIDQDSGQLHDLTPSKTPRPSIPLPGQPNSTIQVAPTISGDDVWLIQGNQLVVLNPVSGVGYEHAPLPAGDTFGDPVTNAGKGYVADDTTNQVLVYDSLLHLVDRITVPAGVSGTPDIQLTVKDSAVWADNPTSSEATVIQPDGKTQIVDKGTGDGVVTPGQAKAATHKSVAALGSGAGTGTASVPAPSSKPGRPKLSAPSVSTPGTQKHPTPALPALSPPAGPPDTTPPLATRPTSPPATAPPFTTLPVNTQPVATAPVTTPPVTLPPEPTPPPTSPPVTVPITPPHPAPTLGSFPKPTAPENPTKPTPTPTTAQTVKVPTGLEGEDPTKACQVIDALQLKCNAVPKGQAPKGTAPNQVTSVAKEGQTVPVGTSIEVDYYATGAAVTVPPFTSGEDPSTYCASFQSLNGALTCKPNDKGPGNPKGQVTQTEPAVGTAAPYGSQVLADYFSSSKPIYVPQPGAAIPSGGTVPTDPKGYCNYAGTNGLGFNCLPTLGTESDTDGVQGLADPAGDPNKTAGDTVNQVVSTDPAPSSTVGQPYGSDLTATYFDKTGVVVPAEDNQPAATACDGYQTANLVCGSQTPEQGASGQTPGNVVAGSEMAVVNGTPTAAANLVVASGTTVNFGIAQQTVPTITPGEDEATACAAIQAAGMTCQANAQNTAFGTATGFESGTESPAAGTTETAPTTVSFTYSVPDPGVQVLSCIGAAVGGSGTTVACPGGGAGWAAPQYLGYHDVASDPSCNTISGQSAGAGSQVATGTLITPTYYACSNTLQESHAEGAININGSSYDLGQEFHNLTPGGTSPPANFTGGGADTTGGFVPFSDGSCMSGTVRLYQSSLNVTESAVLAKGIEFHYDYTLGGGFGGNNWTSDPNSAPAGTAGDGAMNICLYPPSTAPAGDPLFYAHPIANPHGGATVDWSWSTTAVDTPAWNALPGA